MRAMHARNLLTYGYPRRKPAFESFFLLYRPLRIIGGTREGLCNSLLIILWCSEQTAVADSGNHAFRRSADLYGITEEIGRRNDKNAIVLGFSKFISFKLERMCKIFLNQLDKSS